MQAVQSVGMTRQRRRVYSKHVVTTALFKKLGLPVLLILTVMLAVFIPTGADNVGEVVMSAGTGTRTSQSSAHTLYSVAVTKRDSNDGGKTTPPSQEDFYVDAASVVPVYNQALSVPTSSGLVVGLNSPTTTVGENAFVTNVKSIVSIQFEETVQIEKNLGGDGAIDVPAAVDQFLSKSYMFGANYYASSAFSNGGPLRGAIGPALLDRNYYAEDKWAQMNGSSDMWNEVTKGSGRINLMLVAPEDVEGYRGGSDVDVYYVEYGVVDAKGHCAPWGLAQTYMTDRQDSNAISSWPIAGGYGDRSDVVTATKQATRVDTITALWQKIRQTGVTQYWLPYVSASSPQLGLSSVQTDYGTPIHTGMTSNLFESGNGPAYDEFKQLFSGYTLVGVLVLTNT